MGSLVRLLERPLAGPLAVALLGLVVVAAHAPGLGLLDPDLVGVNDQVGYITTARWLADEGELRSHIVYPAFADVPGWRLYMPGHYAALALAYLVLGAAPWVWIVPGLASLVLGAAAVFWIGRRLYGAREGLLAALVTLLFPANVAYAFSAMSEPTFGAACTLSFAVFLALPERARFLAAPLLVALAFLFRETGALLVLPMALLALRLPPTWRRRGRALATTVLGSVVTVGAAYAWQVGTGKQPPPVSWIVRGEPNYTDALLEREIGALPFGEVAAGIGRNLSDNVSVLVQDWLGAAFERSDPLLTLALALLTIAALARGVRHLVRPPGSRDPYPLAAGLMGLAAIGLVLLFHKSWAHVAIRHLLFTLPFTALAVAPPLVSLLGRLGSGRAGRAGLLAAGALLLVVGYRWTLLRASEVEMEHVERMAARVEAVGHDPTLLLAHPRQFGLGYMLGHYPVRWSFVPENDETLFLLNERLPIGTLIFEAWYLRGGKLHEETLARAGLERTGDFREGQVTYLVYQRKR